MTVYTDTSVLVSAFTHDINSGRAQQWFETRPEVVVSNWTTAEFSAAIGIQLRQGRIDERGFQNAESLMAVLASQPAGLRIVAPEDIDQARSLVLRHSPLRAPDALHLAIAIRLGMPMATFDHQLKTAAVAAGCKVVDL